MGPERLLNLDVENLLARANASTNGKALAKILTAPLNSAIYFPSKKVLGLPIL
jgi:hypothetical protein